MVKPYIYEALKRLYGDHVDEISLLSRPIRDHTGKYEYSATCAEHGNISGWVTDITIRTVRVHDHLKGIR